MNEKELGKKVLDQVRDQVRDQVMGQFRDRLWWSIDVAFRATIWREVDLQVRTHGPGPVARRVVQQVWEHYNHQQP